MKKAYLIYGLAVLSSWAVSTWQGFELGGTKRGLVPQNVRQSPGGYRSYNYWRGGK